MIKGSETDIISPSGSSGGIVTSQNNEWFEPTTAIPSSLTDTFGEASTAWDRNHTGIYYHYGPEL